MCFLPDQVIERLTEALDVADRMYDPQDFGPKGFKVAWPQFRRKVFEDVMEDVNTPAVPSPTDIGRMYEALAWLHFLDRMDARLVRMRLQPKRHRFNPDDVGNSFLMLSQNFHWRFTDRAGDREERRKHKAEWLEERFELDVAIIARTNRREKRR